MPGVAIVVLRRRVFKSAESVTENSAPRATASERPDLSNVIAGSCEARLTSVPSVTERMGSFFTIGVLPESFTVIGL